LDTNLFEHHQKAKDFHLEKPFDPIPPITIEELNEGIKKLPKRKAPGVDDIMFEHLIHLPENIKHDLLDIYNESLVSGIVPEKWKVSKIKMILKPNKPQNTQARIVQFH
jgi:hypothetical protein